MIIALLAVARVISLSLIAPTAMDNLHAHAFYFNLLCLMLMLLQNLVRRLMMTLTSFSPLLNVENKLSVIRLEARCSIKARFARSFSPAERAVFFVSLEYYVRLTGLRSVTLALSTELLVATRRPGHSPLHRTRPNVLPTTIGPQL